MLERYLSLHDKWYDRLSSNNVLLERPENLLECQDCIEQSGILEGAITNLLMESSRCIDC